MAIVEPGYLSDVELFKVRLRSLYMIQVRCLLYISGLVCSQKLVDHQLGIGTNVKLLNPHVFAEVESGYECLIFSFIVLGLESKAYGLLS